MSVFEKIKAAIAFTGYDCYTDVYTGEQLTYFVMNVSTLPVNFSDDYPAHLKNLCQLHLYAPITQNTVKLRKEICRALAEEFTYPSIENASDSDTQHLVFEFEDIEES